MSGGTPLRFAAVLISALVLLTACGGDPTGDAAGGSRSDDASGLPVVTPQPQEMERLGDDLEVGGTVEIVVDPLVDEQTRALAKQVLREAGAQRVLVREPGAPTGDADLRVRIGDDRAPTIIKELQHARFDASAPQEEEGYVLAANDDSDTIVIGAGDAAGAYYGVQTLRQLTSPGHIAGVGVTDFPNVETRGTIEGFYGSPWTHEERMDQLAFYGDLKLNTYIYAPKDDPYHREKWREPYPPDKLAEVQELIGQALRHHVKFTFALSPGTSICYSDPADRNALLGKLRTMYDSGVRDFSIPLDDINYTQWNCGADAATYGPPSPAAAARAQADLLNEVHYRFVLTHSDINPLQTVPTEYSDIEETSYKRVLRGELDPEVQPMWTGDGVVPEKISVNDAYQAGIAWGRKVMLWDNYPVNDFDGAAGRLMLGPYAEREPGLRDQLTGVVLNPMNQAAASKVVEFGAADFAWNDADFDPNRAWRAAAEYLAEDPDAVSPLLVFFDLQHMAPLPSGQPWLPPAPELNRRLDEFRSAWNGEDRKAALDALEDYAHRIADAPERIRQGAEPGFVADAAPWLDATDLWGDALVATVDGLRAKDAGEMPQARQRFAAAADLARQARSVQTIPGENRNDAQALVADGVLDTFLRQAPEM